MSVFERVVSRALMLAVVGACSAAFAQNSDPIVDRAMAEKLVGAHYDEQLNKVKAEIERRKANEILYLTGQKLSFAKKVLGDKNVFPPVATLPPPRNPCAPTQRIFVRRNSLDTFALGQIATIPLANAKGASISVTQDDEANQTSVAINGRLQAVVAANDALTECVDGKPVGRPVNVAKTAVQYAIAPYVDGQGTITNPRKPTEASALQTGVDFQFSALGGPIFDRQYITFTPYYQTDFRTLGHAQGIKASWEPTRPDIKLGGRIGIPSPYFDWFWQFRAEYDARHVIDPGATGLTNRNYQWVGAVAQIHFTFFPDLSVIAPGIAMPMPDLADRIFLNLMANYYRDIGSGGRNINLYEVELGYNLTADGKSSVSVKYDKGVDKDTLQGMQKYLVGLNYKY